MVALCVEPWSVGDFVDDSPKHDVEFASGLLVTVAKYSGATATTTPGIMQRTLCQCSLSVCLVCWLSGPLHS